MCSFPMQVDSNLLELCRTMARLLTITILCEPCRRVARQRICYTGARLKSSANNNLPITMASVALRHMYCTIA